MINIHMIPGEYNSTKRIPGMDASMGMRANTSNIRMFIN